MGWLVASLQNILNALTATFHSVWNAVKVSIQRYWWLFISFAVSSIFIVVSYASALWNGLQGMIGSALVSGFNFALPSGADTSLCLLNHVIPVTEFFTFLGSYLIVVATVAAYRFIKTLIPTVAGV